jgi:hypothetical protein
MHCFRRMRSSTPRHLCVVISSVGKSSHAHLDRPLTSGISHLPMHILLRFFTVAHLALSCRVGWPLFRIGECHFWVAAFVYYRGKAVGPRTSVSNPPKTAKVIKRAMKAVSRIVILGKPVALDTAVAGERTLQPDGIPLISLPTTAKLRIPV